MLRTFFFAVVVRPLCHVVLGFNVRRREALPQSGPAIVVANHNSHLDALALMALFPLRNLSQLRPVAAQDYFFRNRFLKWFALNIIGIIPIERTRQTTRRDALEPIEAALDRGDIVILFPEGSRGEPERMTRFKTGIVHLAMRFPAVPIIPVFTHGLGKALPRGEALLVPFFCDVFVGEPHFWNGDRHEFMDRLNERMISLAREGEFPPWE
ncbi:MAG: 1-acyl-sn-glycerol-3-phosphate acyltransferase [Planctomycetia bacterium]|nr:1-acyl-sn-glycerol-3-phosphate acyltransferase [Planctomycetia bacterium]